MHSKKYRDYLDSLAWLNKREEKLRQVRWKCERSGFSECQGSLQVHHKHYNNLGNEHLSDLEVLCESHHLEADYERQLDTWAAKKYGADWKNTHDEWYISTEYEEEMESRDLFFENDYDDDWDK